MATPQRISPCLWFDGQAEAAARFYVSVFPNARITRVAYYGEAGREIHGHAPGTVLTVEFELDGTPFLALNGGPQFQFNESVSFTVYCDDQAEVDHYWSRLGEDGDPAAQQCGWLKDRFGVSWQVVPRMLPDMMADPDTARRERVMTALLKMKKLDIAALQQAHAS
jgi:predicted 3-demethylubiquinone-9 3-methyltransferase (glyoxalase superfamily)